MTTPRFESMPAAQLEELLRRKDLPPADRRAIQAELGRRIAGNLTNQPAPPPPPAVPRPVGPPPGRPPVMPRPMPAAQPQPRPHKPVAGKIIGVLAVVAAVVAAAVYFLAAADDTPAPSETGYTCYVSGGSCPLAAGLPVGASCECFDDFGAQYVGTVG